MRKLFIFSPSSFGPPKADVRCRNRKASRIEDRLILCAKIANRNKEMLTIDGDRMFF